MSISGKPIVGGGFNTREVEIVHEESVRVNLGSVKYDKNSLGMAYHMGHVLLCGNAIKAVNKLYE